MSPRRCVAPRRCADQWCEGIDAEEYVCFLKTLWDAITCVDDDGNTMWRALDELGCPFGDLPASSSNRRGRGKGSHRKQ